MPAAPAPRAYRAPAFVVAMLLLVAVGVTMMFCVRSLTTASELTAHANRVIATTESLRAGHRMVETSATAYLQTGESRFLREYMSEAPTLRTGTQSLAALIESSHDQHARVTQIGALVEARLARLRQEVDRVVEKQVAASPGRPVDADASIQIPALLDAVVADQRALLDENMHEALHQKDMMTWVVVAGILIPMVLLSVLQRSLALENRRSRRLERETKEALDEVARVLEHSRRVSEHRRLIAAYASVLQSCQTPGEAMQATARLMGDLLPNATGRCYLAVDAMGDLDGQTGSGRSASAAIPLSPRMPAGVATGPAAPVRARRKRLALPAYPPRSAGNGVDPVCAAWRPGGPRPACCIFRGTPSSTRAKPHRSRRSPSTSAWPWPTCACASPCGCSRCETR